MGNCIYNPVTPSVYFTQLGATIVSHDATTTILVYKTLQYTCVYNNGKYIFSQRGGKLHTLKDLKLCEAIMKHDVVTMLQNKQHNIQANVWKDNEVRFSCNYLPQPVSMLFRESLLELLNEFGIKTIAVSKTEQIIVTMNAAAIEDFKAFVQGRICIVWVDLSIF